MTVSIVVPVYNESENVQPLYQRVSEVLETTTTPWEIVFVNDGSTDDTCQRLDRLAAADSRVKVVELRRNFGQTAALRAGIREAGGEVIVTIDGDLQNDPADIPMMLDRLAEGYDVVYGWRKERQDRWLNRRLPSLLANRLIAWATGFPAHDLGCALKVIRREVALELDLYGDMHRFLAILAHWRGAKCLEVVTRHHPRQAGKTKYGIGRTPRVLLDLITVIFLLNYFCSPMRLFGMFGLTSLAVGFLSGAATVAMKVLGGVDMTGNPLLLLTVFASVVSVQFFSLGLLGELGARIYFNHDGRENYAIRRRLNLDNPQVTIHRDAA
jgi:glycosyltransferase involved in cell wall biosynthesis